MKGRRAHGIDLLRLLAAVQMISGHTIDALIAPEHRVGLAWTNWTILRGLTAVAFLFASGVSFAMVAAQSPERRRARVKRALMLIAISYALHPPVEAWRDFFAVDVLACIGVTLLVLEGLARVSVRGFGVSSGVLGAVVIAAAPLTAPIVPSGWAMPLLDYLTKSGGSLFPLLPFSGFALLGGSIGTIARPREAGMRPTWMLALAAVILAILAGVSSVLLPEPPPETYYAWPTASFARIATVVGFATALTVATLRVDELPKWMTTLAGETLFLYVSHLLVLYVAGIGLVHWIGGSLSLGASITVALSLIVTCSLAALAWARRAKTHA
jgi:uncharacterized membrane protein